MQYYLRKWNLFKDKLTVEQMRLRRAVREIFAM